MSEHPEPRPEARGDLQPPGRRPPTAVGTATPPPPRPPMRGRRRASWPRRVLAVVVLASPIALGAVSWLLVRGGRSQWTTGAGWLAGGAAIALAGILGWIAVVLPVRDRLRTRTADRIAGVR